MPTSTPTPEPHTPALDLLAVQAALRDTPVHGHLHHLRSTPSTQTLALQAARAGARHGVWVADEQTAGRGRGTHTWHSPARAGLLLSVLVTPSLPLPALNHLSLAVAIACQAAIADTTGLLPRDELDIRWPNDLLLRGPRSTYFRKVGGILIETAATPAPGSTVRFAVIGIGINCNHTTFPPELDHLATSLRRDSADPARLVSRELLLAALLRHLDRELTKPNPSRDLSRHSSWLSGKRVTLAPDPLLPDAPACTGTTAGLTPEGFLRIQTDDGTLRIVRSGGVRELDPLQIQQPASPSDPSPLQIQNEAR